MREPMKGLLWAVIGVGYLCTAAVQGAAAYTWSGAVSGNWSDTTKWTPSGTNPGDVFPNGGGTFNTDTVTIDATGGSYTVTVDAARQIGSVTLDSANATLTASSKLTIASSADFKAGTIGGVFSFSGPTETVTVNKSLVTVSGATTYKFSRYEGDVYPYQGPGGNYTGTFDAGDLSANETFTITQTDWPYTRGYLRVTTANGYVNNGSIIFNAKGYAESTLQYILSAGTLTNRNSLLMNNVGATLGDGPMSVSANILNDTGGTLTVNSAGTVIGFTKANGQYENRGAWNVQGNGLTISGDGASFTQNTPGASLTIPSGKKLLFLNSAAASPYSVTLTNGSFNGYIEVHNGDVTVGPDLTATSGSTLVMAHTNNNGGIHDPWNTAITRTLSGSTVPANLTLQLLVQENSNAGSAMTVNHAGDLLNQGTLIVQEDIWYPANAYSTLNITGTGATLTNQGILQIKDTSSNVWGAQSRAVLNGSLANLAGGTVTLLTGANVNTRTYLGAADSQHQNLGTMVFTGANNYVRGASFSNQGSGILTGTGTVNFSGVTGGLQSSGHIAPGASIGTLSVTGNVTLLAGSLLDWELGGTGVGDLLDITGGLNVTGWSAFRLTDTGGLAAGNSYTLINYTGTALTPGAFALLYASGPSGMGYQLLNNTGNTSVDLFILPEPASLALLALAGAGLLARRRR